jgi:hypothetical protein
MGRWRKRWESNPKVRSAPFTGFEDRAPDHGRNSSAWSLGAGLSVVQRLGEDRVFVADNRAPIPAPHRKSAIVEILQHFDGKVPT